MKTDWDYRLTLHRQVKYFVQDAIERSVADTNFLPFAEQVFIKRIRKDVLRISVKVKGRQWQQFTLVFNP